MQDIAQDIRIFVIDNLLFGQEDSRFSNDDSFLERGLIDSVGILTLVEFVREEYANPANGHDRRGYLSSHPPLPTLHPWCTVAWHVEHSVIRFCSESSPEWLRNSL